LDAASALKGLDVVAAIEQGDEGQLRVVPRDGQFILAAVGQLALERGWHVDELQVESGQLDDVFRDITTAGAQEEART